LISSADTGYSGELVELLMISELPIGLKLSNIQS